MYVTATVTSISSLIGDYDCDLFVICCIGVLCMNMNITGSNGEAYER